MKTKKFLLGGLVLLFAIGSAIASAFQPTQPHVRGRINITPAVWACVPINTQLCNTQGIFECVVRIPVNGVLTNVLAYGGTGFISPETSCIIPLRRNTPQPVPGTPAITILEVRPWDLR